MRTAKIIYASLTGNTKNIVKYLQAFLKERSMDVSVEHCKNSKVTDFENSDICIVATYTYGNGELPVEIVPVYDSLGKLDLSKKVFGVCGSGDEFYDEFCHSVDLFEKKFFETGARKGADNVKVDVNVEEEDVEKLKEFCDKLCAPIPL